jgi:hypothetical protein
MAYLGTWKKYTPEPSIPKDSNPEAKGMTPARYLAIVKLQEAIQPLGRKIYAALQQVDPQACWRLDRYVLYPQGKCVPTDSAG